MTKVTKEEYAQLYRERMAGLFQLDPDVEIVLNNVRYNLKFNNAAVKGVLKDTGLNLYTDKIDSKSPEFMSILLLHGLRAGGSPVTLEDVDVAIDYRQLLYIQSCITKALDVAMPDMSDVEIKVDEQGELNLEGLQDPQ